MNLLLPALDSFTVILIGGTASLIDGGPAVDIRAEHHHDPFCDVTGAIAANSQRWWETATSLVRPMVAATNHLAQASVFGKRTVSTATAAGDIKRTRLTTLLDGGVATVKKETVAKKFEDADWLLSDYQLHNMRQVNPDLRSQLFVSTDESVFTVLYDRADLFQQFESFVSDGSVLIMPHTRLAEQFLNAYAEHQNLGREPDIATFLRPEDEMVNLAKAHPPLISTANFQVTGLFAANNWQDPRPLEAARQLKVSRYDIKAGLWDLVNDDALRETMLDEQPLQPVTSDTLELPENYLHKARTNLDLRSQRLITAREEREGELEEVDKILRGEGWITQEGAKDKYSYQILPATDLRFDLYLNKASAAAYLATSSPSLLDEVIKACKEAVPDLRKLYVGGDHLERADSQSIWRAHATDGLIGLALRAVEIRPLWEATFGELIDKAPTMLNEQTTHAAITPNAPTADTINVALDEIFPGLTEEIEQIAGRASETTTELQTRLEEIGPIQNRKDAKAAIVAWNTVRQQLEAQLGETKAMLARIEGSSTTADLKFPALELTTALKLQITRFDTAAKARVGELETMMRRFPPPPSPIDRLTSPTPPRNPTERPNSSTPRHSTAELPPPPHATSSELAALRQQVDELAKTTQRKLDQAGVMRDTSSSLQADSILVEAHKQFRNQLRPTAEKLQKKNKKQSKKIANSRQVEIERQHASLVEDIDRHMRTLELLRAKASLHPTKDRVAEFSSGQKEAQDKLQRRLIELGTIKNRRTAKKALHLLEEAQSRARKRYLELDDLLESISPHMPLASETANAVERLRDNEQRSINNLSKQIVKVRKVR